jgi:hypothetical protein
MSGGQVLLVAEVCGHVVQYRPKRGVQAVVGVGAPRRHPHVALRRGQPMASYIGPAPSGIVTIVWDMNGFDYLAEVD